MFRSNRYDSHKPMPQISEELLVSGEHLVVVVRKHIIGIVKLYIQAFVGILAVLSILFVSVPEALSSDNNENSIVVGLIIVGLTFIMLFLFVATYVYRQSRMLVTDKNLIQITQSSLFIRKISRLSMSNVEDVSADQRGLLATIFNYGTLFIQTAGEHPNFEFKYCPDPNNYADQVLEARQTYAQHLGEIDSEA